MVAITAARAARRQAEEVRVFFPIKRNNLENTSYYIVVLVYCVL